MARLVLCSLKWYMRKDVRIECYTDAHQEMITVAWALVAFWPIGMPLIFLVLLFAARSAIVQKRNTALNRATAFLHQEYRRSRFWWEPVFMVERLIVAGFLQVRYMTPRDPYDPMGPHLNPA